MILIFFVSVLIGSSEPASTFDNKQGYQTTVLLKQFRGYRAPVSPRRTRSPGSPFPKIELNFKLISLRGSSGGESRSASLV